MIVLLAVFFVFVYNVLETARVTDDKDKNPNRIANGRVYKIQCVFA